MTVPTAPPSTAATAMLRSLLLMLAIFHVDAVLIRSRGSAAVSQRVTPVQKVTDLLKKLSAEVTEEGKKEAAQYDKFACFCKEQADEKLYAVEKSTKKLARLNATISQLEADIADLNGEIASTSASIKATTAAIGNATSVRQEEHADYEAESEEINACISALEAAIEAMENSKAGMTDAKLDLVAVASKVLHASSTGSSGLLSKSQLGSLEAFRKSTQPVFQYSSNSVLTMLQDLLDTFNKKKKETDETETRSQHAFELKTQGMTNEVKFASQDKMELEKIAASKEEASKEASEEQLKEGYALAASQTFLKELTAQCEEKGELWDQRSSTRAEELKVLKSAIDALETGVAPNWSANKKLSDLQKSAGVKKALSPAFIQLHKGSTMEGSHKEQLVNMLATAAAKLQSPSLSMLAMKAQSSGDHFVKVRGLIKDLLQRLQQDKSAEADQKAYCDEHMKEAISTRDAMAVTIEAKAAAISAKSAKVAQLKREMEELSDEIASRKKALAEATELRAEEQASNQQTLVEATEGKKSVDFAIQLLKEFYNDMSLVQKRKQPEQTVSDMAPKVFEDEYDGKKEASTGIIGLLQVISTDFERTLSTVASEEEEAARSFGAFKEDTEADIKASEDLVKTKSDEVSNLTDAIVDLKEEKATAEATRKAALKELDSLKSMCVDGEESWEERAAAREKEVEALKQALRTLDDWQS